MTLKTLTALALAASGTTMFNAAVADTGFYAHGGFNSTTLDQNTTRNTGSNQPNVGAAGGSSGSTVDQDTGASFYVAGGYEFTPFPDSFAAVEVFYADESAETQNINNVKITEISLNSSYGIDLKLGQNVTDKFAVYGILGVTQYDFDGNLSYTFAPPMDDVSSEEASFVYGGGVELDFNDRWSTIAEVRFVNDLEFNTPVDRGGVQSSDELDMLIIRSGLKYRF